VASEHRFPAVFFFAISTLDFPSSPFESERPAQPVGFFSFFVPMTLTLVLFWASPPILSFPTLEDRIAAACFFSSLSLRTPEW